MKLLRNKEVRSSLFFYIIIAVAAFIFSFMLSPSFALFTALLSAIYIIVFLVSTNNRYKKIKELSECIDRILHGKDAVLNCEYCEGEIAILGSEIHKMTVRLREQSQQLTEDKIFLANSIADISHQIRTPLTSINLLISLLSEPDINPERKLRLTHELYELLSRIDWLITSLMKISKIDAGTAEFKKENVSLEAVIKKAVAPLIIPMELKEQELYINASGIFTGDLNWTSEAIGNIVKNCTEHTDFGGKISISASENPLYSEIIITDNGKGIREEDLPHIFKRFYKGKNSDTKSFGIGLALSRMIIVSQNGTVKAENNEGNGAKFIIKFYKGVV